MSQTLDDLSSISDTYIKAAFDEIFKAESMLLDLLTKLQSTNDVPVDDVIRLREIALLICHVKQLLRLNLDIYED